MCACDTFILLFVTDSLSCILNSFISTLLKKYYTFNGHLQPSRPFFGESRLWEVCGCKPQEIRLQKFKRQIQVLKMSEAKLVESGAIAKDLDERFFGENSSPKLEGGAQKWKWDRVCSKLSCLTWFSLLSWHLENAKVARAFPAAQGWNIVAWWFGKGNPLQALHDVGGLLEGPWDRQTFWRIRKVKWHNPTNIFGAQTNSQAVSIRLYIYIHMIFSFTRVALWGCQGRTCSRYQWWCHVRYHRGGTIQFEGQWSGENHGWMAWREMRVRKQDFNSAIRQKMNVFNRYRAVYVCCKTLWLWQIIITRRHKML